MELLEIFYSAAIISYAFEVVDETWKINHKSESSA
jgi:hypothetical protein